MHSIQTINQKLLLYIGAGTAQLAIYGVALLILVVGIRKVATLQLTEANLFFGIILVLILALQAVIMGTLIGLQTWKREP